MRTTVSRTVVAALTLAISSMALAGGKDGEHAVITTWVTDTHCGAMGAATGHAACAAQCVKNMGAKWALYNTEDKILRVIPGQDRAGQKTTKIICNGMTEKNAKPDRFSNESWS